MSKICVKCGEDVSGRPRVKDRHGRYMCRPCLGANGSGVSAGVGAAAGAGAGVGGGADGLDALLPEDLPVPLEGTTGPTCPSCGASVSPDAVLCVSCGYNRRTGAKFAAAALEKPPKPGAFVSAMQEKRAREEAESDKMVRMEYAKPFLLFGIGVLGVALAGAAMGGAEGGVVTVVGFLIMMAVLVPVAVVVYFGCVILWLGFDAPVHLTILRILGAYSLAFLGWVAFQWIPVFYVPFGVGWLMYAFLLQWIADLDLPDAAIVSCLTFGAQFVGFIMLAAWLSGLFA